MAGSYSGLSSEVHVEDRDAITGIVLGWRTRVNLEGCGGEWRMPGDISGDCSQSDVDPSSINYSLE